jgi:hypothetical protein
VADIAELSEQIVRAAEGELEGTPERIIIEPLGKQEVNVRVGLRTETHPVVYHRRRSDYKPPKK